MRRIGIDLGGTKIEGVLLEEDLGELRRLRVPTARERGYEAVLGSIAELYRELAREAGEPHALGVGTPGAISPKTGLLKNSNTTCLNGRPVQEDLGRLFGRPFALQNDANCFALAEARLGAGRGHGLVFGVILGTGCGGGIVIDGTARVGPQRIAGEWGHMVLDPSGPPCYCGARGCVEAFISGGGLERRWQALRGERRPLEELLALYRAGEPAARELFAELFARFGQALANLINALDPDIVVLGGGVSNIDELYSDGIPEVRRRVFTDACDTPIVRHALGDSAGVLGAALIGIS